MMLFTLRLVRQQRLETGIKLLREASTGEFAEGLHLTLKHSSGGTIVIPFCVTAGLRMSHTQNPRMWISAMKYP